MQSPETSHFRLLILGDGSVRTVPLVGDRWTVGRALDCSIPLRDPTVSRKHVLIERIGNKFHFQDLGGANPASIDGQPARAGVLDVDQPLTIGLTRLVLEERRRPAHIDTNTSATVVLSREVIDDELPPNNGQHSFPATAAKVLQSIEWTFADLGELADAAEPLLDLAINLTGRQAGWIARFHEQGSIEMLAASRTDGAVIQPELPESSLSEARRIDQPHLLTTRENGTDKHRLIVPLGKQAGGLLVLEDPIVRAPAGQELLRLAQSLGTVIWHRLHETMERARLRDELERLRFHDTVTHNALLTSRRLQDLREQLRSIAAGEDAVLLVGEQGTEREDLARYLHAESPKRSEPFLAWDVEQTLPARHATELFGGDGRPGLLPRVGAGVLFVDHPSRLTTELQQRLAAALANSRTPTRLILGSLAAPDDAWAPELRASITREAVRIPPLREDARDVLALAELFLSELGTSPDGSPRLMTERSKRLLTAHGWPGNVRELRLVLEAAAAQAGNQPIAPRHLPAAIAKDGGGSAHSPLPTLEDVEREHIHEVMERTGGVRSRAAQILGIASSTLYEKLKKYRIDR